MPRLKSRLYRLLRAAEKYTKTDMIYLAKGGFWSTAAQVVNSLLVFGFAILVAHFLPKDVYGQYKYIIAMVALLGSFSLTGLGSAMFQSVASGFDGALRQGFVANLRWSAAVFLGAFGLAAYYFLQGNTTLAIGVLVGGSLSPFLTSANLAGAYLNAKKDFARANIYFGIVENLVAIGALIIAVLLTKDPLILAIVYFVGNTLATWLIYRRVVRLYQPDPAKTDPGMMGYAKHLSLMGVLTTIAGNIDQVLLFHFVGPVELALYNFAIAIPDQTKGPLKMFDTMTQARFVSRADREISVSMRHKMWVIFATTATFVAAYALAAPYIYRFFFPNYIESILFSQIYALSLFSAVFSPAASYLTAKKKIAEQYTSKVVLSLFQIIVLFVGVLYWGLLGLIWARVVLKVGGAYFTYTLYRSSLRKPTVFAR